MNKMKKKITIIGIHGKMGQWFAKYFVMTGFEVIGYDSNDSIKIIHNNDISISNSLIGSVLQSDYVMLCTPTKRTPEIIRLVSKEMKKGTYLIDISSQKSKTAAALMKIPLKINPLCIHPMFGPGIKNIKKQNIISIPIKDAKQELTITKSLFNGANFVTIDVVEHDKKIAVILGLTHLVNLILANILSKEEKFSLVNKMSGITFKAQKIISESIMNESSDLIETIISNPEIRSVSEKFWKDMGRMITLIQEGKTEEILNYISVSKTRLQDNVNLEDSYMKLLQMMNTINK